MPAVARTPGIDPTEESARALSSLYGADETAWLEEMSRLAAERRHEEFDYENLTEFLHDMAIRERREVLSRLVKLLMHLLKWEYQPAKRTGSWRRKIREQRQQLGNLFGSGTLRNHAEAVLQDAYRRAVELASDETGLARDSFPASYSGTLDDVLRRDPSA